MYCTNCGTQPGELETICANCGQRIRTFAPAAPIENYLIPSILTTFCCCLPFGIVALVYAAQVNSKVAAGDIEGAKQASQSAKTWTWVAFGMGLLIALIKVITLAAAASGH